MEFSYHVIFSQTPWRALCYLYELPTPPNSTDLMSHKAKISLTQLPDASQPKMDFLDSSFFRKHGPQLNLPTPEEVRGLSPVGLAQPLPVKFEQLGLVVKFGPRVTTAEAQCLWIIRHTLRDKVPVPEVYGWRVDGREVFVYHPRRGAQRSVGISE